MDSMIAYEAGDYQHREYLRQAAEANAHRLPAGDSPLSRVLIRLIRLTGNKPASTTDNCRNVPDPLPIRSS